jgi:hypothetical protein
MLRIAPVTSARATAGGNAETLRVRRVDAAVASASCRTRATEQRLIVESAAALGAGVGPLLIALSRS